MFLFEWKLGCCLSGSAQATFAVDAHTRRIRRKRYFLIFGDQNSLQLLHQEEVKCTFFARVVGDSALQPCIFSVNSLQILTGQRLFPVALAEG